MDGTRQRALLAASVAGLVAAVGISVMGRSVSAADTPTDQVHCYGINKCKGTGDCGGKEHACAGKNACKGASFIELPKDICLRIAGGRLTAEPQS